MTNEPVGQGAPVGQTLGHYVITEKIGAGGMGEVFRAHDQHLNRDVAVKLLPPGTLSDEAARKRFRKEALALSKLNHPNIATIHDFDTQRGVDFLVMEYIPGTTLNEKISGRSLPEREVVTLGAQLADGLSAAHEHGVIHRDLKPGNLRLTSDGRLKILDFGLARLRLPVTATSPTESLGDTDTLAGTLPYMAPEQLLGGEIDARTDIHAAGAVLYEMATGQQPFALVERSQLIGAILHRAPQPATAVNPKLSPELGRIIGKCLEKEPENRYQSAKELAIDLRRLSPTPSQVETEVPATHGHRWLIGVAGLMLVGALAAIVIWRERAVRTPAAHAAKPSAAVLPFKNLSADPENEYFSDGMTEEIITKLSRIPSLAVASRTSVARFKNTQTDIKEIGRELGVRYVLEGSVRKAGNQVRITAQLIDSETGFHVWAEDFDRDLKDIFAVQDETALKIAGALNLELSPKDKEAVQRDYTQNLQAYEAFLQGRALTAYGEDSPDKLAAAGRHFEEALKLDPNYAPALAGLCGIQCYYYRNIDSNPSHLRQAEELAQRALAIDPELADAHLAQARVFGIKNDYAAAAQEANKAIHIEPGNAFAWDALAWALAYEQPPDALGAEKAAREALRLQLDSVGVQYHLGRALLLQGRYQEAITAFKHAGELSPASALPAFGLGQVYLSQGDYDRAITTILSVRNVGEPAMNDFWLSVAYAGRGDKQKALDFLQKALEANFRDFAAIDSCRYFSSLRSDPRFMALVSRYRKQQN